MVCLNMEFSYMKRRKKEYLDRSAIGGNVIFWKSVMPSTNDWKRVTLSCENIIPINQK